jgi:hypothetical protein
VQEGEALAQVVPGQNVAPCMRTARDLSTTLRGVAVGMMIQSASH